MHGGPSDPTCTHERVARAILVAEEAMEVETSPLLPRFRQEWLESSNSLKQYGFTKKTLELFAWSSQSIDKAYAMAADVFQLEHQRQDDRLTLSGFVHSEMKSGLVYKCSITMEVDALDYLSHYCPCKGALIFPTVILMT